MEFSNDNPLLFEGSEVYLTVRDSDKEHGLSVFSEIENAIKNPEPEQDDTDFLSDTPETGEDTNKGFLFDEEQRAKLSQFYPDDVLFDVEMREPDWENDEHGKIWVTAFNREFPAKLTRIMKEDETFYEASYERKGQSNREEQTDSFAKALDLIKTWHEDGVQEEETTGNSESDKPSFLE